MVREATKSSKYRNRPVFIDGTRFASAKEGRRYSDLKLLVRAKQIEGLTCHPRYSLIINGALAGHYTPDFGYTERGKEVVEEVKSEITKRLADYVLRRNVFKILYPNIEHRELCK
jgi:hypothetical protein